MPDTSGVAVAVVHLRGHGANPAELRVTRFATGPWIGRVLGYTAAWLLGSWATLVLTFDPFVACFPFVIGLGGVYRTVRGRYRVEAFQGQCPRCGGTLNLQPGTKIPLPYPMVCYGCHHEPELRLVHRAA